MKTPFVMTAAALSGALATSAFSADYKVERSLQLPASSAKVWSLAGDFCDIDDWHPGIKACVLKVIDGKLHRVLTTTKGAEIVQQRIAEEVGISYTYKMKSGPLALDRYTATFSVVPNDGSRIVWSARFKTDDPSVEAAIAEMFETGLPAIESMVGAD